MSDFSPTTGSLSYSALLLPAKVKDTFGVGLGKSRDTAYGFQYVSEQQTGAQAAYGSYSVYMGDNIAMFGNPEQNYVEIYSNPSGLINPTFNKTHYLSGTGNILASKAQLGESLTSNGRYLAVGAPGYFDQRISGGRVYIFGVDNTYGIGVSGLNSWGLSMTLTGAYESGAEFGKSLDILTNFPSDTLGVGAPKENLEHGAAYIFNLQGVLQKKLDPPINQSGQYGRNIKMVNSELLFDQIGVAEYTSQKTGEVHIYQSTRYSATNPNEWGLLQTLRSPESESGDFFGSSMGSSLDYFIIGSPREDNGKGRVYVYDYDETSNLWNHYQTIQPTDLKNDNKFGKTLSFDGVNLTVGSNFNSGCVHLYQTLGKYFTGVSLVSGASPIPSGAFGGDEMGSHGVSVNLNNLLVGSASGTSFYFYYTGGAQTAPAYECLSISGISGKIIDNDGNYVFGYNSGEKIEISGNVFPEYHNYYINNVLVNTNCSRYPGLGYTGAIDSITLSSDKFISYVLRVNG